MADDASSSPPQSRNDLSGLTKSQLVRQVRSLQQRVLSLTTEANQAQETLRETEHRYDKLLESVPTYAYSVTLSNGAPLSTTHGSGCLAITGFTPEEYASTPHLWIAMVHPDDRETVQRHVAKLLAGKHVPPIEHRIRRKDGKLRWVRSTIVLHHDDDGQLHRYDGLIEDITKRKRAEEHNRADLRVQNVVASLLHLALEPISLTEQLERTLDHLFSIPWLALQSRGSIFLIEDDPQSMVMKAHRGLPAELLHKCDRVSLGICLCGSAAANQNIVFAEGDDAHGESPYCGIGPHAHYCLPIVSHDRVFGVLNLYMEPGHKRTPEAESFLSSVADLLAGIIKHKLGEDALRRSEERFDLAVRGTDAGIWDWDLKTNEVYFSPRWKSMLGYKDDEIANSYYEWENRLHPADRERALMTIRDYLEGKSTDYELEHRLQHKDGTYRWIVARGAAVFDRNGKSYRMVGSHIDITHRKQLQAESTEHKANLVAAQRIQQHLLPVEPPSLAGFDIAGKIYPAVFAAGDVFDYLPMPEGSLGIVIGDVTGHGFASALLMSLTHAYLQAAIRTEKEIARILSLVNKSLIHEIEDDRFVTLVLASLDPRSRLLTYASAGHPTGYVFDSSGNVRIRLESTGMPLAVRPDTVFPVSEPILLLPGDVVVLITDGALEARSPEEDMFGRQRLLETVRVHLDKTASEIIDSLYRAICDFSQREPPLDDIAFVVVKVKGGP